MHPSGCALRRITGLRYPHHTAHAEACLRSATAAPAPSRFLRRRRRRGAVPGPAIILSGRRSPCVGADALHRPASLRHRKAHGTMQASSPTKHKAKPCRALQDISAARRQCTPQSAPRGALPVCGTRIIRRMLKHACILRPLHLLRLAVSAAGGARLRSPLQGSRSSGSAPQSLPCKGRCRRRRRRGAAPGPAIILSGRRSAKTVPHRFWGAGLFCRDAGGPFGGQRPAASGVPVSETAASGVAAGASSSSPRRHSRCSSSGICSATQVPSSCCVIPSSISG